MLHVRIAQSYGIDADTLKIFETMTKDALDAGLAEEDPAAMISHAYAQG